MDAPLIGPLTLQLSPLITHFFSLAPGLLLICRWISSAVKKTCKPRDHYIFINEYVVPGNSSWGYNLYILPINCQGYVVAFFIAVCHLRCKVRGSWLQMELEAVYLMNDRTSIFILFKGNLVKNVISTF